MIYNTKNWPSCPYDDIDLSGCETKQRRHPEEVAYLCTCGKYSTFKNGKLYPHDDPEDSESLIALQTRV